MHQSQIFFLSIHCSLFPRSKSESHLLWQHSFAINFLFTLTLVVRSDMLLGYCNLLYNSWHQHRLWKLVFKVDQFFYWRFRLKKRERKKKTELGCSQLLSVHHKKQSFSFFLPFPRRFDCHEGKRQGPIVLENVSGQQNSSLPWANPALPLPSGCHKAAEN